MTTRSQYEAHAPQQRLLRLPEVIVLTGISRSELYRRMAAGTFPSPVKLGARLSAWPAAEVSRWIETQISARSQSVR